MTERLKQHRPVVEKGAAKLSGFAEHVFEAHHEVEWDIVQILDIECDHVRRLVSEWKPIRATNHSMNHERSLELPVPFLKLV